ncbi:MAG: DUF4126 family protein [Verrucomicrobia bacterium]|nr:DUF4126 family protein [Verrucomicrobiota bacterium]
METAISLLVGIGLSAACGFRVFVPLLVVSLASHTGHLALSSGFEWMGSNAALIAFGVATVAEVAGYYVPWVDNFLDGLAGPAAVVAGTLITASLVTEMSPFLKWTLAVIAGGGVAGLVQGTTTVARGASTFSTAGLANPLLATVELGGALVTSLMAILVPALVLLLVVALIGWWCLRPRRSTVGRPAADRTG